MWRRIWEQCNILPLVWNTKKAWTGKCVVQHGRREPLAIEHYFKRGFCYETIVHFLAEYHGISMNVRTLKRRLRHYGLRRRNHLHSEHAGTVREIIKREIVSPSSLLGYRGMWNKLRTTYHVTVPRDMVMKILRELDLDASALRRARKLQRRSYVSPGPNATWHVDGTWQNCFFDFQNIFLDFMTILGL